MDRETLTVRNATAKEVVAETIDVRRHTYLTNNLKVGLSYYMGIFIYCQAVVKSILILGYVSTL